MNLKKRFTRNSADRLLAADAVVGEEALSALLNAAVHSTASSTVAWDAEEAATAAFRAATASARGPATAARVRRFVGAPLAALAAAGVLAAGGGIAFAASQGSLHVPFTGHDHRSSKAPNAPATANPGLGNHSPSPGAVPSSAATGVPTAPISGLCTAYRAGTIPAEATNPAFAALTAAAGGAAKVDAYCATHHQPQATPTRPVVPTSTGKPAHAATPTRPAKPTRPETPTNAVSPTPHLPPTHPAPKAVPIKRDPATSKQAVAPTTGPPRS